MQKKHTLFILATFLLFASCGKESIHDWKGMFNGTSPHADQRFEDSQTYNNQAGFATVYALDETYRVYVCTDTHIKDSRNNWETFIRAYYADNQCPVAIHLGDQTNGKGYQHMLTDAFLHIAPTPGKWDTLFTVLGNHDIYFDQWDEYKSRWHTASYYFIVQMPSGKKDFYLIIDTAEGTMGEKQLAWVKSVLSWADTQPFRHRFVCSHTHLLMEDYSQGLTANMPLEETYCLLDLFGTHHIDICFCGHDHTRQVTEINGCMHIIVDALEDSATNAAYLVANVGETIHYDFVSVVGQ